MLFVLLLAPPLLSGTLALAIRPYRRIVGSVNAWLSLVSMTAAATMWRDAAAGAVAVLGDGTYFRADALSALLAACVSFVTALAAWLGPGLGPDGDLDPTQVRRFRVFINAFAFTMLAAVTTDNLAFMWIAIEATTITSAFLIPLRPTKAAIEASWKYLLLASVGIALAFAGTVLAYFDFVSSGNAPASALYWTTLVAAAPSLHPEVIRLSFVFVLIGYGTKAGLAPMHTWLPDAHSEAPAPLSAMMSGVLLAVAMYAIVRWSAVVRAALGPAFGARLLVTLGVLSLAIGAFSLVAQRNYKRLLAYSSIEHTGLVCVGLALGPLGVFAAMLHLLNHTLAKATMFFLSGRVLRRYRTAELSGVSGLLRAMPWTGVLFACGVLALIGLPPFGLFISEFALVRAGFLMDRFWLTATVLVLLTVAFVALVGHLHHLLYGAVPDGTAVGERRDWGLVPLALSIALLVVLGLTLPAQVEGLLTRIVETVAP